MLEMVIENQKKKKLDEVAQERAEKLEANQMPDFAGSRVPPMTTKAFSDCFKLDLDNKVIKPSVEKSEKVAMDFILDLCNKKLRSQETQTNSMDELFEDF